MKILFLTRRAWPMVGGVEKHIKEVTKELEQRGHKVRTISEADIKYPHLKYIGLLYIWIWLLKHRRIVEESDVVHCHDVFVWYLPFRFLYPRKKCVATIHGLEWDAPLRNSSIFVKRLTTKLANKTVGVGKFLERYLSVRFDLVIYGAANIPKSSYLGKRAGIVYVGRLEENTGLLSFLLWLRRTRKKNVIFCGDGTLRGVCEEFGVVKGFVDPAPFYTRAKYCVPGGYLAALEGMVSGCELKLFWNNKIKENYWKMSPFAKKNAHEWAVRQTWARLANEYLNLYNSI